MAIDEENAQSEIEVGFVVRVSYPRGHHRYRSNTPAPFGDGQPLPRALAELLAWSLRQQGANTELMPVQRQLSLFSP